MKKILTTVLSAVITATLLLSGCATIISGPEQNVMISSKPAGAVVRIYNSSNMEVFSSDTPATAVLKRGKGYFKGESYRVEIKKEGYEQAQFSITSEINGGWYIAGNILAFGWILGLLVLDPITGAMWTLSPDNLNSNLEAAKTAGLIGTIDKNAITIVLRESIPDDSFGTLPLVEIR